MTTDQSADAGMREIAERYGYAGQAGRDQAYLPDDDGDQAGPGLDVMARLEMHVGRLATAMDRETRLLKPRIPWAAAHPVPIPHRNLAAAGTSPASDEMRPMGGTVWRIRRLTVVFSAGTTSVTIYKSNPVGPATELAQLTGSGLYEPAEEYLFDQDMLTYVAAGGGADINGQAVQIELAWLPTYLM